jgi:hypothetical protein
MGAGVAPSARLCAGAPAGEVHRWRVPPGWLWPVSVVLQVGSAIWLTSYTYFFFDDYLFLRQAQTQHFGIAYLRESLFEHFSPISRVLDTALVHIAPGSFALAHGVQLAIYAAAIAAFALVVRTILGNGWTAFILTAVFGQSVFLMRMLHWWTATANTLPATVFMLVAIAGYLRWRSTGSRSWLVVSVIADFFALLDYETAMLFPVYLALISLLVLEDSLSPRTWLKTLWRERWAWLCYTVLAAAALVNYYEYYYSPTAHPSAGELAHFLWIALFESFVPALVGIKDPQAPISSHAAVIALAGLCVAAAVALTLYQRPRAWRCIPAFAAVFLVTMIPIGLNRVKAYGVGVGQELDYQQSLQFMTLIFVALGLSRRWGGQRTPSREPTPRMAVDRLDGRALAALGVVAIAGYGALYVTSVKAMAHADREPREARAYVNAFLSEARRIRSSTGREPDLIDHEVPANIMFSSFVPYNRYDQFFALVDSKLRIDELASTVYFVNEKGHLVPAHFSRISGGLLGSASVSAADGTDSVPAAKPDGSSACIPTGRPSSRLHIPLAKAQTMTSQASGFPYAVRVHFRMPIRTPIPLLLAGSSSVAVDELVSHVWGPGEGAEIAPLSVMTQLQEVDFELPAAACVTRLEFGTFKLA